VPAVLALDASGEALLWAHFRSGPTVENGDGEAFLTGQKRTASGQPPSRTVVRRQELRGVPTYDGNPTLLAARFARLSDAQGVLHFAQQYGVLEVCEHGLPRFHSWPLSSGPAAPRGCEPLVWPERVAGQQLACDPIAVWLSWARRVRAFRQLVSAVKALRLGDPGDWEVLLNDQPVFAAQSAFRVEPAARLSWLPRDSAAARHRLMAELEQWFRIGGVQFRLGWEEYPSFRLAGSTFATIAIQLFAETAWGVPTQYCDSCGVVYQPVRRPRDPRGPTYCPECRVRRAAAIRMQRLRAKRRQQGS
jgi:hypothetical protein